MRKYFHLLSDGKTVREITSDEWFRIVVKERDWANSKLVATLYDNEISFNKGHSHIFVLKSQLDKILKEIL